MTSKQRFEGYHDDHELPIKRGDTVLIPKGTVILTTGKVRRLVAGRNHKVLVDHILCGMNRPVGHAEHNKQYPVQSPSVRWAGSGGYWHEVDINDVEKV